MFWWILPFAFGILLLLGYACSERARFVILNLLSLGSEVLYRFWRYAFPIGLAAVICPCLYKAVVHEPSVGDLEVAQEEKNANPKGSGVSLEGLVSNKPSAPPSLPPVSTATTSQTLPESAPRRVSPLRETATVITRPRPRNTSYLPEEPRNNGLDLPLKVPAKPPGPVISYCSKIVSDTTGQPIPGAKIALEHESAVSEQDGTIELLLSSEPDGGDILRVSHGEYVSRFFRYDNLTARKEVRLEPKYRLIVVEFGDHAKSLTQTIRRAAENQLTTCREIELLAEDKRDQIVQRLFEYQEERALYDKDTLAKVGSFLGATHGVFGSITHKTTGAVMLECSLVHLETATQEHTVSVQVPSESLVESGTKLLIDQLLAKLAEVRILSPLSATKVPRRIDVSGYGVFLPASWHLWVSIMPLDSSRHYPQMRPTVQNDGTWTSPGVQIGSDDPTTTNPDFAVFAVLTNPDATERIEKYLGKISQGSNEGLDLGSWGEDCCKILNKIEVVPQDK